VRSDVPGGAEGLLVPPVGVTEAGGARARVLIEHLRAQIRALEQVPVSLAIPPAPGAAPPHPACSFLEGVSQAPRDDGVQILKRHPELRGPKRRAPKDDATGPLHKLEKDGLHEIKPDASGDWPAALAFALAVIAQQAAQVERRGLVLWCLTNKAVREWGRPYGPGLIASGLNPARLLLVMARNQDDAAWALEEGLKSRALIAALAAIEIKTPLMARRLSLAAQAARTPCLLLSNHRHANLPGTITTWRIATRKSGSVSFDATAPGRPHWQLTLERCRGEAPGQSLIVEFSHESLRFRLSPAASDRAAEAGESIERRRAVSG
jgi:protein ImuA